MRYRFIKILLIFITAIFISMSGYPQEINKHLEGLKPILNKTWEGTLKAPDGSAGFRVIRTFEIMDKGNVIKCTKINPDLDGYGEGYFYWDDVSQKISFFFIEDNGVFNTGFVTIAENIITIEGEMTWPAQTDPSVKQSYNFKNTFELKTDSTMIDRWFMDAFGPWRPGHTIEYKSR